jgi:hypothetical protein
VLKLLHGMPHSAPFLGLLVSPLISSPSGPFP